MVKQDNLIIQISAQAGNNDGNLRYWNKEKSRNWFQRVGLQLPELETVIPASSTILTSKDFVNCLEMAATQHMSPPPRRSKTARLGGKIAPTPETLNAIKETFNARELGQGGKLASPMQTGRVVQT